jgi:hypothetical protein
MRVFYCVLFWAAYCFGRQFPLFEHPANRKYLGGMQSLVHAVYCLENPSSSGCEHAEKSVTVNSQKRELHGTDAEYGSDTTARKQQNDQMLKDYQSAAQNTPFSCNPVQRLYGHSSYHSNETTGNMYVNMLVSNSSTQPNSVLYTSVIVAACETSRLSDRTSEKLGLHFTLNAGTDP